MKLPTMLAKTASFAHLLGLPKKAARAEDDNDDDKKQRPDESDDDYAKRMEEEEDKDKKDSKAEGDEDGKAKSEKDDDDEAEEDEDGDKKAKKAEDGEDDDSMRSARKAERQRCAAIFASEAAGVRPDVAAHLAFNTDMSAKDAVALLGTAAAGGARVRGLADRMAGVNVPTVGAEGAERPNPGDPKAIAARVVAAAAKARGEKK